MKIDKEVLDYKTELADLGESPDPKKISILSQKYGVSAPVLTAEEKELIKLEGTGNVWGITTQELYTIIAGRGNYADPS